MIKRLLSIILAITMVVSLLPTTMAFAAGNDTTTVTMTVTYDQTGARSMLSMINAFRTGGDAWYWNSDDATKTTCTDLSDLNYDYTLEAVAMQRAAEIALSYSHTRPNGENCETSLYEYYTWGTDLLASGENIAAGYNSADAVFEGWKETNEDYSNQGQRRNMLSSSFTAVGIAHVTCGGCEYWVQVFGNPTTLNATETSANNSETNVSIDVLNSSISSVTLTASPATYTLSCNNNSVAVPTVTAMLVLSNTWPSGSSRSVSVSPTWSSSNAAIVTINNGSLHVLGNSDVGSTTIAASALGKTISVPVTVSHGDIETQGAKDATGTEDGYTGDEVCTDCGKTIINGETIHNYKAVVTEPTCTEKGYTTYTCSVCGDSYTVDEIGATGHSWDEGTVTDPTCTAGGYTTYTCTVCGDTYTADEIGATGHSWDEGIVTEPTCTAGGYTTYTCTVCGDSYTADETRETGHSWDEGIVTEPTCTAGGYTTYTCTVCGDSYVADETGATGHSWDEGTVTTEATCTEEGVKTYTCTVCGETKTEKIEATGHSLTHIEAQGATCTADGNGEYWYCSECGKYFSDYAATAEISQSDTVASATGHSYYVSSCTWASDYSSATLKLVCDSCGDEIEIDATEITSEEDGSGNVVYKATVRYGNINYSHMTTVEAEEKSSSTSDPFTTLSRIQASYTGVQAAIAKANALNPDDYENFSAVTEAIEAVDWSLNVLNQKLVNSYAEAIEEAIENLVPVETVDITEETIEVVDPVEAGETDSE